jgi:hypothetical protein
LRIHVSPARRGRVQVGPRTDPRHRNLRSLRSSPRPPRRLVSLVVRPRARPGHTATSKKRGRGYGSPRDCHQPQPESPAPSSSMAAGYVLPRCLRRIPFGRFLETDFRARRPRDPHFAALPERPGLEVRNDRYSVLRSRGGVRGEGADAQLRRRRSSLSPPRSQGAPQSGGRRLGRCLTPNGERAERCGRGHTQATPSPASCEPSSYFKQASTESNALVSAAVTQ